MFTIAFVPGMKNEKGYELGYMMLGSSRQGFRSGLSCWSMEQYQQHWHDAVMRLVNGAECSALITDLPPSSLVNHLINWWPMWREGDVIYIREQLIIQSELKETFDPSNFHKYIDPRSVELDSSQHPSEWVLPLQDFVEFLQNPS